MIVTVGVFAMLFSLMPSDLFAYQEDYNPVGGADPVVVDYFNARNITLYKSTWYFNFTFSYGDHMEVLEDVPVTDSQIEFHGWQDIYGSKHIEFRHAEPSWFFGLWLQYHFLDLSDADFAKCGSGNFPWLLTRTMVVEDLALDTNSSAFLMSCDHVSLSVVILNTGDYATLADSWDAGEITVLTSYEIDFDAMKPSAFTLITQLITFQDPDFGIPGMFGDIINYLFAVGFWIVVAIIIYTIITKLVPTVQGGIEN